MKMIKINPVIFMLLFCSFLICRATAGTLVSDTEIHLAGGDFTDLEYSGAPEIPLLDETNLVDLPQFNPATGTLTSATLTIAGNFTFDAVVDGNEVIDNSLSNELAAGFTAFVGAGVPIDGVVHAIPDFSEHGNVGCFEGDSNNGPCSQGAFFEFNDMSTNAVFTGTDLAAFIGTGTLMDLLVAIGLGLDEFPTVDNIDFAFIESNVNFDGTVSIQYDYTAVPVPAAVWFFVSGLIGLLGFTGKNKKPV